MSKIVKWFAKKYIINIVNDTLKAIENSENVKVYFDKVNQIIDFCTLMKSVLSDNKVTKDEADSIVDAAKSLFLKKVEKNSQNALERE